MSPATPSHNPADRAAAIDLIRMAMIEKKITQAELASEADCHEKTVQNLLGGRPVRDQTLFDICTVLGLDFQSIKEGWSGRPAVGPMELRGEGGLVAPVYMGAYTRAAVEELIGTYLTVRPAFSKRETFIAYLTSVTWDPDWPSLLFEETERPDAKYQHRGRIYVPASSPYMHFVSLTKGAMRMIMLSQIDQTNQMRGIITTLNRQGAALIPVAAPIVYRKLATRPEAGALGEITPEDECYAAYREMIGETLDEGFARLVSEV